MYLAINSGELVQFMFGAMRSSFACVDNGLKHSVFDPDFAISAAVGPAMPETRTVLLTVDEDDINCATATAQHVLDGIVLVDGIHGLSIDGEPVGTVSVTGGIINYTLDKGYDHVELGDGETIISDALTVPGKDGKGNAVNVVINVKVGGGSR
jgi:hypothetical protein